MGTRPTALLIDDDVRLGHLTAEYLGANNIDLTVCDDPLEGLAALRQHHFDVVLLDIMLPGIDGLQICRKIRATPELATLPVVMLTAKGDDVDKVIGLELGADDYVAKPFNPRELLARLRALLRRAVAPPADGRGFTLIRCGDLTINIDAREVIVRGQRVLLTHHEFELLAVLARSAGHVLSRGQLLDALRGDNYEVFERTIDVHVAKLRAKIELDPRQPRYIKTMRGVGYVFMRTNQA